MSAQDIIKMHNLGGALYVDIEIWNRAEQKLSKAFLNFDTGATVTTISADILASIGYNIADGKIQKITTGSGVAYVREIIIDKVKLGNSIISDVRVYAHTFPDESYLTGVIGLNIISLFDINLLFSNRTIEIKRILLS